MRPIRTLVVAGALLSAVSAHAAKKLPDLKHIASTDDCFSSYSETGQHCELSYCLNTVMGEGDQAKVDSFEGCSSRTLASLPTAEESPRKK